jgi:pyruvate dehydrogenase E2 component (dihydrolipoamide acetyltransferase)
MLSRMPALSPTMTAGNIASIKVKAGDKISPGDLIMDIETDKATMGWEAQEEGIVAAVLVKEGDQEVPVGQVVLVMVDDAADIPAFSDYTASASAAPAAPAAAPAAPAAPAAAPAATGAPPAAGSGAAPVGGGAPKVGSGSKVLASPLARALAREAGVDLSAATPTGPHGYVAPACVLMLRAAAAHG